MSPAPYGSWQSPIAAADLAVAGVRLGEPRYDGDDLYWTEGRPAEQGRVALLRERAAGEVQEVAPGLNVRTRVHEYGGGAWDARAGVVVVSVDPSGQLLRVAGEDRWPLTPAGRGWRFADLRVHPESNLVLAVREDHSGSGRAGEHPGRLAVGRTQRRRRHGAGLGRRLLRLSRTASDGRNAGLDGVAAPRHALGVVPGPIGTAPAGRAVETRSMRGGRGCRDPDRCGGPGEAAVHPLWRGEELLFCSDRTGFWELYARQPRRPVTPLTGAGADLVEPFWVFGRRPYALTGDERLVLRPRLARVAAPRCCRADQGATQLAPDVVDCDSLDACGDRIAPWSSSPTRPDAIIELTPEGRRVVRCVRAAPVLEPEWVSRAEAVSWARFGGGGAGLVLSAGQPGRPRRRGLDKLDRPDIDQLDRRRLPAGGAELDRLDRRGRPRKTSAADRDQPRRSDRVLHQRFQPCGAVLDDPRLRRSRRELQRQQRLREGLPGTACVASGGCWMWPTASPGAQALATAGSGRRRPAGDPGRQCRGLHHAAGADHVHGFHGGLQPLRHRRPERPGLRHAQVRGALPATG